MGDGLLDYWRIRLMFSGWVCFPSPSPPRSVRRWGLLCGVVNLPGSSVTGPGWWWEPGSAQDLACGRAVCPASFLCRVALLR